MSNTNTITDNPGDFIYSLTKTTLGCNSNEYIKSMTVDVIDPNTSLGYIQNVSEMECINLNDGSFRRAIFFKQGDLGKKVKLTCQDGIESIDVTSTLFNTIGADGTSTQIGPFPVQNIKLNCYKSQITQSPHITSTNSESNAPLSGLGNVSATLTTVNLKGPPASDGDTSANLISSFNVDYGTLSNPKYPTSTIFFLTSRNSSWVRMYNATRALDIPNDNSGNNSGNNNDSGDNSVNPPGRQPTSPKGKSSLTIVVVVGIVIIVFIIIIGWFIYKRRK